MAALAGAMLTLLAPAACAQEAPAPLELRTFPRTELTVIHRDPQHGTQRFLFDVWVADTEPRAEQGLMFVSDLPENKGMLFPLTPPRVETMWMKNTYIELDMLFVRPDGHIAKIIERAHPLSLATLSSDEPVGGVVELKGGVAAKLGLHTGDTVTWKKPTP